MLKKILYLFVSVFVFISSSVQADESKDFSKVDEKKEVYKYLNIFGEAFEKIKNNYVEAITVKKVVEAAIDGMLS